MPCHHIDDGSRHEERRDAARTAGSQFCVSVLDQRQAANARADHAGNACGQVFGQGFTCGQACVQNGLLRSRDAVMNEGIHGARIFGAHVLLHIKSLDLTRNLAGEVRCIELGDEVNTGLAGQKIGPGFAHRVTHGGDAAQTGHDNATTAHAFKPLTDR